MITSKRLVRGAFESADLPRLPFIPWVFTHAAKLEQTSVRRMFSDPTQYTKCLHNTQALYGYDAIISSFDSSLEMEICGYPITWRGDYEVPAASPYPDFDFSHLKDIDVESASKTGRFSTVIESSRRINMVSGTNLALAAVINGPLTLMAGLTGRDPIKDFIDRPEEVTKAIEATGGFLLKVAKIYCQLELDIIAIADRLIAVFPEAYLSWLQSTLSPIINTIRFYNAFSVLLPGKSSPDSISNLIDLGFDGVVVAGTDVNTWNKIKGGRSCILGEAIPSHLFTAEKEELRRYIETHIKGNITPGFFLTTDWEVPADTPPDNINLVMNMISQMK
jgi:uroporphyrinogen-III decarboxylase